MEEALHLHDSLMRRLIAEHNGYEVKTEGDAFMVAFYSVDEAVKWCCAVQRMLLEEEWPASLLVLPDGDAVKESNGWLWRGLRVRMGLHYGKMLRKRNLKTGRYDYFGPAVNLAARVAGLARGGQILLSSASHKQLSPDLHFSYEDLGEQQLKVCLGNDLVA